jgi:hypothetical protein
MAKVKYSLKEAKLKIGKSKTEIRKSLTKEFNKFIRNRDKNICFTCGNRGEHAGHYIPATKPGTRFNVHNVHCQCVTCNSFKHGNLTEYEKRLREFYKGQKFNGMEILDYLHSEKNKSLSKTDMELLLKYYKELN